MKAEPETQLLQRGHHHLHSCPANGREMLQEDSNKGVDQCWLGGKVGTPKTCAGQRVEQPRQRLLQQEWWLDRSAKAFQELHWVLNGKQDLRLCKNKLKEISQKIQIGKLRSLLMRLNLGQYSETFTKVKGRVLIWDLINLRELFMFNMEWANSANLLHFLKSWLAQCYRLFVYLKSISVLYLFITLSYAENIMVQEEFDNSWSQSSTRFCQKLK